MTENVKIVPATARPENLYWIMSEAQFMYLPTRTLFKRDAVVRQIGGEAATLVEKEKVCSNLFWAPGLPVFLKNQAVIDGALDDFEGNNLFNLYKAPRPVEGDPEQAGFWLELGEYLFGDDLPHLLDWLAFKVQHPEQKINHAIVLGSYDQGVFKDSWLAPIQIAVGSWNWKNVTAGQAKEWTEKGFTASFLRKVICRISEVHDLGAERFKWYDQTKDWCAAPPEMLTVADKCVRPHDIMNVVGVIYTTNHKADGLYVPPEDRRHYFAWSERRRADFQQDRWRNYWPGIERDDEKKDEYRRGYWQQMKAGAGKHVAAYLASRDVSRFNPGADPPQTPAWHAIVAANAEPQDADLLDVLDRLDDFGRGRPAAVTLDQIRQSCDCPEGLQRFFADPKNRRTANHRLERAGYASVNNPDNAEGRWRIEGKRQMVYAQRDLSAAEQQAAARDLIETLEIKARMYTAAGEFGP
jgi:hypothetical protein